FAGSWRVKSTRILARQHDFVLAAMAGRIPYYPTPHSCFAKVSLMPPITSLPPFMVCGVVGRCVAMSSVCFLLKHMCGASHLHSFIKGNDELVGREEQRGDGWEITNSARLASYQIDIARRTMMMTSGKAFKYKSSMDALSDHKE
ncbi:hypothetical protein Tco_0868913, partial [Tanacetum coccineum]